MAFLSQLGKAIVSVEIDSENFSASLKSVKDDVEKHVGTLGSTMKGIGAGLTAGITVPLTAIGVAATSFAMDFNAAMANVATLIPGNTARINELKSAVQTMAVDTGKSTDDLAGGLYEIIGAIGDSADTLKILDINAKAAAAGLATTKEAISFTSLVTRNYGDTSAEAFQKVADLGFQAVNLGVTTFPELAQSMGAVVPMAQATGVSMEELFAIMATFTGVTGNTSEVVTQTSSAITALVAPSKELEAVYETLGVASGETLIKQHGLVGAMQLVAKAADDTGTPLIKLVGRKEAWNIVTAAAGSQAKSFSEKLKAMGDVAGTTDRALKEQQEGINKTGFQFEQLTQRVTVTAQKLGDALMPALQSLFDNVISPGLTVLEGMVSVFSKLPQPVQTVAIGAAALAAALGPVLFVVGGLVSTLPTVTAGLGIAKVALAGMGTTATLTSAALTGIGIAVAAWSLSKIAEASSLIYELWQQTKQADKDAVAYAKQGQRAMAEALRTTGLEAKDHAEALDLIRSRLAGLRGETAPTTDESSKLFAAWQRGKADAKALAEESQRLAGSKKTLAGATGEAGRATTNYQSRVAQLAKDLGGLDAAERREISTRIDLGDKAEDLAKEFKVSVTAINDVVEAHKKGEQASKQHAEGMKQLREQYNGKDIIDNAMKLSTVLGEVGASVITEAEAGQMSKAFGDALDKMVKRGEAQTPQFKRLMKDWLTAMSKEMEVTTYDNSIFWTNFFKDPPNEQTGKQVQAGLTKWMNDQVIGSMKPTKAQNEKFWGDLLGEMPDVTPDMSNFKPSMLKSIGKELSKGEFALEMGRTIVDAIVTGRSAEEIGGAIGSMVGMAIGLGISSGNPIVAQALGTAGALIGEWIGGLFGGDDEEAAAVQQMRDQMLAAFGGVPEAFREIAKEAGVAERQINVLLNTGDPEDFRRHWDAVKPLLDALKSQYEGLGKAIEGVNQISEGLAGNLEKSIKSQTDALTVQHDARMAQLKEQGASEEELAKERDKFTEEMKKHTFTATEEQQIAVDRLGTFVTATFADMVRRTGDAASAVLAMKPAFETLKDSVNKFGLEGNAATKHLLKMYDTINNNSAVFTTLSGLGKVMEGLGQALVTDKDLASAFGSELAFQFKNLVDGGVDSREALALMQPQLQKLWEAQEKFGEFTDEGTKAMLDQAAKYNLVGPDMKDVNKQILDVLVQIRDMFRNDIPGAIPRTQNALDSLRAPNLRGRITFDVEGAEGASPEVVMDPTRHGAARGIYGNWGTGTPVMLHGPEVVMPLDRFEAAMNRQWDRAMEMRAGGDVGGYGGDIVIDAVLKLDEREVGRFTKRITQDALRRGEIRVPPSAVRQSGVQ
jgi:TP901 family phage tail tape measure protein